MSSVKRKRVAEQRKERGMMRVGKKWKRPNIFIAFWDGARPPPDKDFVPWGYATDFKFVRDERNPNEP